MNIVIKRMETDEEIIGKAFVHWKSWHETYQGLIDDAYLEKLSLTKCEEIAYRWRDNIYVAKDGDRVIGFIGFGEAMDEMIRDGEIFALYVLSEYHGKRVGQALLDEALAEFKDKPQISLWVLRNNWRAIRFYEKNGFAADGHEQYLDGLQAYEIRMIRKMK